MATMAAVRAPQISRDSTSRPRLSVPSQYGVRPVSGGAACADQAGACSGAGESCSSGSGGGGQGGCGGGGGEFVAGGRGGGGPGRKQRAGQQQQQNQGARHDPGVAQQP